MVLSFAFRRNALRLQKGMSACDGGRRRRFELYSRHQRRQAHTSHDDDHRVTGSYRSTDRFRPTVELPTPIIEPPPTSASSSDPDAQPPAGSSDTTSPLSQPPLPLPANTFTNPAFLQNPQIRLLNPPPARLPLRPLQRLHRRRRTGKPTRQRKPQPTLQPAVRIITTTTAVRAGILRIWRLPAQLGERE